MWDLGVKPGPLYWERWVLAPDQKSPCQLLTGGSTFQELFEEIESWPSTFIPGWNSRIWLYPVGWRLRERPHPGGQWPRKVGAPPVEWGIKDPAAQRAGGLCLWVSVKGARAASASLPCNTLGKALLGLPGGLVVRTQCFHCRGHWFNPWSGN